MSTPSCCSNVIKRFESCTNVASTVQHSGPWSASPSFDSPQGTTAVVFDVGPQVRVAFPGSARRVYAETLSWI